MENLKLHINDRGKLYVPPVIVKGQIIENTKFWELAIKKLCRLELEWYYDNINCN